MLSFAWSGLFFGWPVAPHIKAEPMAFGPAFIFLGSLRKASSFLVVLTDFVPLFPPSFLAFADKGLFVGSALSNTLPEVGRMTKSLTSLAA